MNIPTATEFLDKGNFNNTTDMLIEFAKLHVEAALEAASEKTLINRKPTGNGDSSDEEISTCFEGDLGYEDYIPVEYTINKESILNAYPLTNIK